MNRKNSKNYLKLAKNLLCGQIIALLLASFLVPALPAFAVEPLVISDISITRTDKSATITWHTNRLSYGRVDFGFYSNDYNWTLRTAERNTIQAMTISNLLPETDYYFKITAEDNSTQAVSFERSFTTLKSGSNKAPEISDVHIVYVTGATATIQWLTDEPATSELEYGLKTTYGSSKGDGNLVKVHDITISGLVGNAPYHVLVKSKDKDNNIAKWYDLTFQTMPSTKVDKDDLIIYDVKPASENDLNVTQYIAVISWRSNKLAEGTVRYGLTKSYNKSVKSNPPRDFTHNVTLTNLTPDSLYYFEVEIKDVFGKTVKSIGYSFKTKSNTNTTSTVTSSTSSSSSTVSSGQVLGISTMSVDLKKDFGFYGMYYNLSQARSDMELWKGESIPNTKIGRENDWYNSENFVFARVDQSLNFGNYFLPITEKTLPGDPYHFAVNWRAIISVPQDDFYTYKITSDDDSWILIDDKVISNLNGVHSAKTDENKVYLTTGYHKIEIFYAERSKSGAVMSFIADNRLKFHPLPDGQEGQNVLDYNNGTTSKITPMVLGVSTKTQSTVSAYVCNPNLGYTRFKALYKTTASPDIWAILENGTRHYITSPAAFAKYQCDWNSVKTVSKATLEKYPVNNLVRSLNDPTTYFLFQRPNHKWLKINFPSPTVFVSYDSNYWGNVSRVDDLDIQAYPDVKLIKAQNGSAIYLIEGKTKRLIKSEAIFAKNNFNWAEVVEINKIHIDSYQDGPVLE